MRFNRGIYNFSSPHHDERQTAIWLSCIHRKVWQHLLNFNHDCCGEITKTDDNIDFYRNETESQGDLAFMLNFTLFPFIFIFFLSNQFRIVDISSSYELSYVCSSAFLSTIHSIACNKCGIILYSVRGELSERKIRGEDWKTQAKSIIQYPHSKHRIITFWTLQAYNRLLYFHRSLKMELLFNF
jgi:hypothetical protein